MYGILFFFERHTKWQTKGLQQYGFHLVCVIIFVFKNIFFSSCYCYSVWLCVAFLFFNMTKPHMCLEFYSILSNFFLYFQLLSFEVLINFHCNGRENSSMPSKKIHTYVCRHWKQAFLKIIFKFLWFIKKWKKEKLENLKVTYNRYT